MSENEYIKFRVVGLKEDTIDNKDYRILSIVCSDELWKMIYEDAIISMLLPFNHLCSMDIYFKKDELKRDLRKEN